MLEGYPKKPKKTSPFIPASFLQALGNLSAYYAYLESASEITIWAFLGLGYRHGTAVTVHMGTISRLQLLTILADDHLSSIPEVHSHFKEMLGMIDAARIRRNDLVHAFWKHEKDKKAPIILSLKRSAKGTIKTSNSKVSLKDIRDVTNDVAWLTDGLQGFVDALFPDAYAPWPRKSASPAAQKTD